MSWFVVGISGVTCGGKTSLATRFHDYLSNAENQKTLKAMHNIQINKVRLIHQDRYFYPRDSPKHTWIEELNFINRELLSAIDTDAMDRDVAAILAEGVTATTAQPEPTSPDTIEPVSVNILLIDGFLIFNDERISSRCQLKFFFQLSFEVCISRRRKRVFKHINPNPERYFREILWPSYRKHMHEIQDASDIIFLNGEHNQEEIFKLALNYFVDAAVS